MLSLLSHQVTLKGQNRVNYATVMKVHCTVGEGGGAGGNSLMKGTGMFTVLMVFTIKSQTFSWQAGVA